MAYVTGLFPLRDEEGQLVDEFDIELKIPHHPSRELPTLREVGGRIPRDRERGNPERHINPDGTACLFIEEAYWMDHPDGYDILGFLECPVRDWLLGQVMFEAHGEWPWEEWEHGLEGLFRCYRELFAVDSNRQAIGFLETLKRKRIKGHWPCPCGSGKRLRGCCNDKVRELHQRLPHSLLKNRWDTLRAVMKHSVRGRISR